MLSRHLTLALHRYAQDVLSAAEFIVVNRDDMTANGSSEVDFAPLFDDHGILSVSLTDAAVSNVEALICPENCAAGGAVDAEFYLDLQPYLAEASRNAPEWSWTGVLSGPDGAPAMYVVRSLEDGRYAVASVSTAFIRNTQRQIQFGEKGHAAIVDRFGRVLAHPRPAWEAERKDISKISIVQAMMRGETGVMTFYSPAMEADMIAGFSAVEGPGWGVMVPQPRREIVAPAQSLLTAIIGLALAVGIAMTAAAWYIAGRITRGVRPIEQVAVRIAAGEFTQRVARDGTALPTELDRLATAIDTMAGRIDEAVTEKIASQAKAQRIEEMNRAKSALLANVSHEFRTPLNAIIGFSTAMKEELFGPLGEERYREYSGLIKDSGSHLLSLVDDVLQVAAKDVGVEEPAAMETIHLPTVAEEVSAMIAMAYGNRCRQVLSVSGGDLTVRGDRLQLKQLLINLVDNAEKYSAAGSTVAIGVAQDTEGGTLLTVADNGIGMSEDEVAGCLQPFGRGVDPHVRQQKGAGLGLSLVQSIVKRHGALLQIESEKGKGTTITVRFPALEDVAAA